MLFIPSILVLVSIEYTYSFPNQPHCAGARLNLLAQLSMRHFIPENPPVAEFTTNELMGHSVDRLCAAFKVM